MNKFLGSTLRFARQKHLSPTNLARILWDFSTNLPTQLEIFHILGQPTFADNMSIDPGLPFRYLNANYLARGLPATKRATCFLHHYRRLNALLSDKVLWQVLHSNIALIDICEEDSLFRITMGVSLFPREGELSLNFEVNGEVVFVLSFSIVPGRLVGLEAPDVLLIARLQGVKGCNEQIHFATKTLHEVAPPALLLAALQGIAGAFEIQDIAGVCFDRQFSYDQEFSTRFKEAYDDFFADVGAIRNAANFFCSPIPLQEKPLSFVKQGHKTRTKRKRAFKQQIADSVRQRLGEDCRVTSKAPQFVFSDAVAINLRNQVPSSASSQD
jgi:uncharacterized protein VirK/YbjX